MITITDIEFESRSGIVAKVTVPPRIRTKDLIGRQLRIGKDTFLINGIDHGHPILNGAPVGLQLEQVMPDQTYPMLLLDSQFVG